MITISSKGSITYSSSNVNLAVIPDHWELTYGGGPQIIYLDYSVTRSVSPSIRLEPHVEGVDINTARECDGTWYNVVPGDHIVARCWMKTTESGFGDTNPFSGARIGFDFYGDQNLPHNGQLNGVASPTYPQTDQGVLDNYVHWGTSNWTQRTIEFIVPATVISIWDGQPHVVTSIVMWLQVWSGTYGGTDPGKAWFADAELYINPT